MAEDALVVFTPSGLRGRFAHDTPLPDAATAGHKGVVDLLVARGAVPDSVVAWAMGQKTRVATLLDADPQLVNTSVAGVPLLHDAAGKGEQHLIQLLLAKGADANLRDRTGDTPLHRAAERGHNQVVKVLLASVVGLNSKSSAAPPEP